MLLMAAVVAFWLAGCGKGGSNPGNGGTTASFTVNFDPVGGAVTPAFGMTGTDGRLMSLPTPTRDGYMFDDWFTGSDGGAVVTIGTVFTENTTIYARWMLNSYGITWIDDDGTPIPTQTSVYHGGSINQPEDMTKTGYAFDGWYTDSELTTLAVFPTTDVTENKTFYAGWTLNGYTATWNTDGGTPVPMQTGVDHGGSIAQPAAMTKTGYTFDGWYTNSALTTAAAFPVTNVTENKMFYAKWTLNDYTVTWNADGGTPVPAQTGVDHGGSIAQPAAMTKTGYTFGGWYTNSALTTAVSFPVANVTENKTFYAKWTLNGYTVTWNADGGTPVPTQTGVDHGGSIAQPANMTKTGYTFGGWYTNSALTTAASFPVANVTENKTFYAKWTPITYTVTFNGNGATNDVPAAMNALQGNSITLPSMTRTGYNFGEWNTNNTGTGTGYAAGSTYTVTGNVTLYAKWTTVPTYTVTFDGNGATNDVPAAMNAVQGNSITLPSMTRTGYNFGEWNTNSTGTGTGYAAGSTYTVTGNVTLYAKWTIKDYTVTWNADGGTPVPVQTGVDHGGSITQPAEITKIGYRFGGWYTNLALTTAASFPVANVTEDKTFYAKWTINYTVTWNADGGTPVPTQTGVDHGSSIAQPASIWKTGHTFGGWYTDSALTTAVSFPVANVTENKTFYAKWTIIIYTLTTNVIPLDGGTVSRNPSASSYDAGTSVTVMATPISGYRFAEWREEFYGTPITTNSITITMNNDKTRTANFYQPGTFTDVRNNKTYRTVKIGNQTWMAENLNYPMTSGSWCYENSADNCVKYGRLYDWNTAKTVCPTRWHLPSAKEWGTLKTTVDSDFYNSVSGIKLKSGSGWVYGGENYGYDTYGFSALPGGGRFSDDKFYGAGENGIWWTASESEYGRDFAKYVSMYYRYADAGTYDGFDDNYKDNGYSVRCVAD